MSLFVINRYEGEEVKSVDPQYNHLNELLKRVAERKAEKEAQQAKKKAVKARKAEKAKAEGLKKKSKKKKAPKRKLEPDNEKIDDQDEGGIKEDNVSDKPEELPKSDQQEFTILGSHKKAKTQVVKRVLPHWLTHAELVSADLHNGPRLEEMQDLLDSKLVDILKADGIDKLFPVQSQVLSWLIKCDRDYKLGRWVRDTCVCMPTGSGKTLAYVLPIIQLLQNSFIQMVRCLIVLPVQELATQVYKVVQKYSSSTSLKVALISGASSFKEEQQKLVKKTENGNFTSLVDIVIATPGRLVDHIRKTDGFSLSALRFLVIDEADRTTDWLQYIPFPHSKAPPLTLGNIRSCLNTPAQKILLSATLSQDPEKLSRLGLFRPILFTSAVVDLEKLDRDLNLDKNLNNFTSRYGNPSELTERVVECTLQYKPLALFKLLTESEKVDKTLVFTNSGEAAHRLAILLQSLIKSKDVVVGELSAQLSSKQREETLEKFTQGTVKILISSDALARGLDIPEIKFVISYDFPKHVKGYIHRAGRTGRGGIPGTAISLLLSNQTALFGKMLSKVGKTVPTVEMLDLEEFAKTVDYQSHLENLKSALTSEQELNLKRLKNHKRMVKT
ncbi:probable ATP-dependent RNA helicase Dbp73D [Copidosoma floridanum]|uniref:probable ATP-dependent RNA helicase Dbp73D n=1 Tax=Copidosoma floridanum TaxID=29053 RepID=UPI0006C99E87|nr:probable ATP-dependent RNA helicase Dbp73D [Copidosoma floridanum]XP_014212476.1 probable ATP-dependent RNA helicase Dbp73D [Copidosoma floridanum]